MLKNVVSSLSIAVGAFLFFLPLAGYWWLLGALFFAVGWLLSLVLIIPSTSASSRGRRAFFALMLMGIGLIAPVAVLFFQLSGLSSQLAIEAFGALAFVGSRLAAVIIGGLAAFCLTLIFFVGVGYFSSIYIVGLHEEEMGFWTAFKSYVYLILGINLAWLVVEDGKIIKIRKQGYVNKWLSRGKIIIKPGNAIVTERGGSITGIHGPGIILTRKDERIRTVFDLRPQVASQTVQNVITADQIPLEIEFGIGYRITPFKAEQATTKAKDGNSGEEIAIIPFEERRSDAVLKNGGNDEQKGNDTKVHQDEQGCLAKFLPSRSANNKVEGDKPRIFKEKKYGLFPVSEATLIRAAFNGTAGGWKGFGDHAPVGQLRDQIMAHDFSEIFEVTTKAADLKIRVNQRQVKRIEDAIIETLNGFADAAIGLTFTFIDIREIRLRDDVVDAILLRLKAGEEAQAIHQIEGERNNVRGDMVTSILNGISTGTGGKIGNRELELATVFAQISRRALTDDVLGLQYIQMLKAIATGDGMKIFNITPNPTTVDPDHIPDLSSLQQNGGSQNGQS